MEGVIPRGRRHIVLSILFITMFAPLACVVYQFSHVINKIRIIICKKLKVNSVGQEF